MPPFTKMNASSLLRPVSRALAPIVLAIGAGAQGIEWMPVGDPGNPNHPGFGALNEGSIPYRYDIARFEVTYEQYAAFLNAVAQSDPNGLYDARMGTHYVVGGLQRTGTDGNFVYTVSPGFTDKPIVLVSFWNACRYANWMENGQPTGAQGPGTTEDGTYTLDPADVAANTVTRNPASRHALPTRPEWWKAGYYEASTQDWWVSPARSLTPMSGGSPDMDDGNMGSLNRPNWVLEDIGSYALSVGPHGTFDMGGNAYEWLDRITFDRREVAGGAFATSTAGAILNNGTNMQRVPDFRDIQSGFRLIRLTDAATSSSRNAGSNPASYSAGPASIGSTWTPTVDLSTTGHTFARVVGFTGSANIPLTGGQVALVIGQKLFQLPSQTGPVASWNVAIPDDASLIGIPLHTQAIHFGGVTPFALSNAIDLTIGT